MNKRFSSIGLYITIGFVLAGITAIGVTSKKDMVSGSVLSIGDDLQLNDFIAKHKNSVVKFYAPWCGFCKMMENPYQEMAQKNSQVKFAKVDCTTEGGKKLAQDYKVAGFPTFAIFKDNKYADTVVGANKAELEKKVSDLTII